MNLNIDSAEAEIDQIITNSLAKHSNLLEAVKIDTMAANEESLIVGATSIDETKNQEEDAASIEVFNLSLIHI